MNYVLGAKLVYRDTIYSDTAWAPSPVFEVREVRGDRMLLWKLTPEGKEEIELPAALLMPQPK